MHGSGTPSAEVIADTAEALGGIDSDRQRHLRLIASIAGEMQRSVEEVLPLYEEVFRQMNNDARIRDYLPIFVYKRVRHLLHLQC